MPIYDFKCNNCHTVYEQFLSIKKFEAVEKTGLPCDDTCKGTCYPVIGATPFVERINLRIADSRQRRTIKL